VINLTQLRFYFVKKIEKEIGKNAGTKELQQAYTVDQCFKVIAEETYLWDMRCWKRYHDRDETLEWIRSDTRKNSKNCGHCAYCIEVLKKQGISLEQIADAIMKNENVQYKNRIVPCWYSPQACPKYAEQGHYGNNICQGCTNNPGDGNS